MLAMSKREQAEHHAITFSPSKSTVTSRLPLLRRSLMTFWKACCVAACVWMHTWL